MSYFYGSFQGGRKEKTITGTKSSGIGLYVRSEKIGLRASIGHDKNLGKDYIDVWVCKGALGNYKRKLGTFYEEDDE